mmetsp:Transcript_32361/g.77340  ORF Transcript_32361/g.77340 Transcript_32361/m.77340 type:complete len:220 (-) Transcript_32361:82-741(-)
MDALAGYDTSDSDGSPPRRERGLSSLLTTYSDASDGDGKCRDVDDDRTDTKGELSERASGDTPPGKGEGVVAEGHARKRTRWDSTKATSKDDALPPPTLSNSTAEPYDSLHLFEKDYTVALRRKLSNAQKSQSQMSAPEVTQLGRKLEQLKQSASDGTSFASRLANSQEFGNPHLLKSVIENHDIDSLKSHLGNAILPFELADQLMIKEERARIAAANR